MRIRTVQVVHPKSLLVIGSSGDDQQWRIADHFVDLVKSLRSDLKLDQWRRVIFDGVMNDRDQSDGGKCDEVWTVGSESWQGMDGLILRWPMKCRLEIREYEGADSNGRH